MKIRTVMGVSASLVSVLNGCASVPSVSRTYYFPRTQQDITVTQTLGCLFPPVPPATEDAVAKDKGKPKPKPQPADQTGQQGSSSGPYSTATATVTTTYIADYKTPHKIAYADFDSFAGDLDIAVGVTDDGRLNSINAAGTGEGGAIVKSAITLASTIASTALWSPNITIPGISDTPPPPPPPPAGISDACKLIHHYGAAGDKNANLFTLTLNYKLTVKYRFGVGDWTPNPPSGATPPKTPTQISYIVGDKKADDEPDTAWWGKPIPIKLAAGANAISSDELKVIGSKFHFVAQRDAVDPSPDLQPSWTYIPPASAQATTPPSDPPNSVAVPHIARLKIAISGPQADLSKNADNVEFYRDTILAPTTDATFIPVPPAKWFGKIATTAQFGASGIVEKLEYNKASPLSDLMASGSQIISAATPAAGPTTAQQAAAIQAQSDLIYQQQRLVACQLDAATCPGK